MNLGQEDDLKRLLPDTYLQDLRQVINTVGGQITLERGYDCPRGKIVASKNGPNILAVCFLVDVLGLDFWWSKTHGCQLYDPEKKQRYFLEVVDGIPRLPPTLAVEFLTGVPSASLNQDRFVKNANTLFFQHSEPTLIDGVWYAQDLDEELQHEFLELAKDRFDFVQVIATTTNATQLPQPTGQYVHFTNDTYCKRDFEFSCLWVNHTTNETRNGNVHQKALPPKWASCDVSGLFTLRYVSRGGETCTDEHEFHDCQELENDSEICKGTEDFFDCREGVDESFIFAAVRARARKAADKFLNMIQNSGAGVTEAAPEMAAPAAPRLLKPDDHSLTHYPYSKFCETCRATRRRHKGSYKHTSKLQEGMHTVTFDIAGPLPKTVRARNRYLYVAQLYNKDGSLGKIWAQGMKNRKKLSHMHFWQKAIVELGLANETLWCISSDRETAMRSKKLQGFLAERGAYCKLGAPHRGNTTSRAEVAVRKVEEGARALLYESGMPISCWDHAVTSFCHNYNGGGVTNTTPPRKFGLRGSALLPELMRKELGKTKLDAKVCPVGYLGPDDESSGCCWIVCKDNRNRLKYVTMLERDVVWEENTMAFQRTNVDLDVYCDSFLDLKVNSKEKDSSSSDAGDESAHQEEKTDVEQSDEFDASTDGQMLSLAGTLQRTLERKDGWISKPLLQVWKAQGFKIENVYKTSRHGKTGIPDTSFKERIEVSMTENGKIEKVIRVKDSRPQDNQRQPSHKLIIYGNDKNGLSRLEKTLASLRQELKDYDQTVRRSKRIALKEARNNINAIKQVYVMKTFTQ